MNNLAKKLKNNVWGKLEGERHIWLKHDGRSYIVVDLLGNENRYQYQDDAVIALLEIVGTFSEWDYNKE